MLRLPRCIARAAASWAPRRAPVPSRMASTVAAAARARPAAARRAAPRRGMSTPAALALANELSSTAAPPADEMEMNEPEVPRGWTLEDKAGTVGVILSKQLETGTQVTVRFAMDAMSDPYQEEEEEEGDSSGSSSVGESSVDEEDSGIVTSFSAILTKPEGSLAFDVVADNGQLVVQSMYPIDNDLAHSFTSEADFHRGLIYQGPDVNEELSVAVAERCVAVLEEAGIDESVISYIYEYSLVKSFREFASWVKTVERLLRA